MPSRNGVLGFHPNFLILDMSNNFLGIPSGLEVSNSIFPLKPTISLINLTKSFMEISTPRPDIYYFMFVVFIH